MERTTMCHGCPFAMAGPPPATGEPFTRDDVQTWTDPFCAWSCHGDNHLSMCRGAELFHDGKLPKVTTEALERFWVEEGGVSHAS